MTPPAFEPTPMPMFQSKYLRPAFSPDDDAAALAAAAAAKIVSDAAAAKKAADDAALAAAELEKNKTKPTDAEAKLLKEVMASKKKLEDAATEKADLAAKLALFDGIDPVAIKALLATQVAAEKAALEKAGDFDRLKAMMATEHAAELAKVTKAAADAAAANNASVSKINDLTIGQAFSTSKFVTDDLVVPAAKARALYGSNFEIEGEAIIAYDKPKGEAARTKLVDGSGNPLSFEESIKRIVEGDPDKDRMLKSKLGDGAGSRTVKGVTTPPAAGALKGMARIEASLLAGSLAKKAI